MSNEETKVYAEADFDSDMMEAINNRHKAVEEDYHTKREEEHKMQRSALLRYIVRCSVTALIFAALYHAMISELIAPVLVIPATYIAAVYFGWCFCKVAGMLKREVANR